MKSLLAVAVLILGSGAEGAVRSRAAPGNPSEAMSQDQSQLVGEISNWRWSMAGSLSEEDAKAVNNLQVEAQGIHGESRRVAKARNSFESLKRRYSKTRRSGKERRPSSDEAAREARTKAALETSRERIGAAMTPNEIVSGNFALLAARDYAVKNLGATTAVADKVIDAAQKAGVNEFSYLAMIYRESKYKIDAVNSPEKGKKPTSASGLAQMTKAARREVGLKDVDRFNPDLNLKGGADYLAWINRNAVHAPSLSEMADSSMKRLLWAWHGGVGDLQRKFMRPETRKFISVVQETYHDLLQAAKRPFLAAEHRPNKKSNARLARR